MNISETYYQEIKEMIYDKGLLVIDLYLLWSAIWKGALIAMPIWFIYIAIKIKFLEWKETW